MQVAGDDFEKGIGAVLRNAWSHVEATQTTGITWSVECKLFVVLYCFYFTTYMSWDALFVECL